MFSRLPAYMGKTKSAAQDVVPRFLLTHHKLLLPIFSWRRLIAAALGSLDILTGFPELRQAFRQSIVRALHQVVDIIVGGPAHFAELCLRLADKVVRL